MRPPGNTGNYLIQLRLFNYSFNDLHIFTKITQDLVIITTIWRIGIKN
jgi:hypothetical protein